MKIYQDEKLVETLPLNTKVLEPVTLSAAKSIPEGHLKVVIGDYLLVYSENAKDYDLERPMTLPEDFDWNSAYGLYTQGEQRLNQKVWDKAEHRRWIKIRILLRHWYVFHLCTIAKAGMQRPCRY